MRIAPVTATLVIALLLAAGCAQTAAPPAAPAPAATVTMPAAPTPARPAPAGILNTTGTPPVPEATGEVTAPEITPPSRTTVIPAPVPHLTDLKYAPRGRISECSMRLLVPDIVNDPGYGMNGPSGSHLTAFSDGQYAKRVREAQEKQGAISPCYHVDLPPYWSWMDFSARLNQISSRPVTYNITLYAESGSLRVPVISSTETLYPQQDYPYKASVPLLRDQADKITDMELEILPVADEENSP